MPAPRRTLPVVLLLLLPLLGAATPEAELVLTGSAPYQVPAHGPRVSVLDRGAACDGVTDDREAFADALAELDGDGGGTLVLPGRTCLVVQPVSDEPFLTIPTGVTVRGTGPASTVQLGCADPSSYVELFRVQGSSIALRDLQLTRGADCYAVMLSVYLTRGLTLDHVTVSGGSFPQTVHGIDLRQAQTPTQALLMDSVTLTGLDYGFFSSNDVKGTFEGLTVRHSTFSGNRADDLEFNAPSGTMREVVVQDNTFRDNQAAEDGAGIGVGLANVQDARIAGNDFRGYAFEPVHLEDRTADVQVVGNRFRDAFTADRSYASHVFVVNGCSDVLVRDNDFDASANTNALQAVFLGGGGPGFPSPSDVTVEGNRLTARPGVPIVGGEDIDGLVERDNTTTPAG